MKNSYFNFLAVGHFRVFCGGYGGHDWDERLC